MANLSLIDKTGTSGNELGKLCTLLEWHEQDPVSDWERRRNERIYERHAKAIVTLLLITLNG
ncbi:endonuclease [Candidatus Regiella insecticola]|uniref:endonuclease n=1 Tax=Candidatus Regiella insecticola TaxID=138073 RepID=UPI0003123032|nr:endonuclease [Candidatus Regiella insecticola]